MIKTPCFLKCHILPFSNNSVSLHLNTIFMKLIFVTIGLLAIAFAGIAIKIWAKKDGEFAGTCASQNPMLNKEGEACGFCGKTPDQFDTCAEPQHAS